MQTAQAVAGASALCRQHLLSGTSTGAVLSSANGARSAEDSPLLLQVLIALVLAQLHNVVLPLPPCILGINALQASDRLIQAAEPACKAATGEGRTFLKSFRLAARRLALPFMLTRVLDLPLPALSAIRLMTQKSSSLQTAFALRGVTGGNRRKSRCPQALTQCWQDSHARLGEQLISACLTWQHGTAGLHQLHQCHLKQCCSQEHYPVLCNSSSCNSASWAADLPVSTQQMRYVPAGRQTLCPANQRSTISMPAATQGVQGPGKGRHSGAQHACSRHTRCCWTLLQTCLKCRTGCQPLLALSGLAWRLITRRQKYADLHGLNAAHATCSVVKHSVLYQRRG